MEEEKQEKTPVQGVPERRKVTFYRTPQGKLHRFPNCQHIRRVAVVVVTLSEEDRTAKVCKACVLNNRRLRGPSLAKDRLLGETVTENDPSQCPICLQVVCLDVPLPEARAQWCGADCDDGHYFHRHCLESWMKAGKTQCPNCRRSLMGGIRCGDKVVALSEVRLEDVEELVRLRAERPRLEEAFFTACVNGKVDIVAFLLDHGVSVHLCDNRESTGLHWASTSGHVDVCKVLLDHGVDLDTVNEDGTSALHLAAFRGHVRVVELLLEREADVQARYDGDSVLHLAALEGHGQVVEALLRLGNGVDVNAVDHDGATPLHRSIPHDDPDIVLSLVNAGANVEARDICGSTPLLWAASLGSLRAVRVLLNCGALANACDEDQRSPLSWAEEKGFADIVRALQEANQ